MSDVEEISRQPDTASSTASEETATHVVDIRTSESPASPRAVHRFTPSRACRPRQGRARRAAPLGTRRLGAGPDASRPGRSPRGAGANAAAGARADPVRADARVAVHLLPRRRRSDGGRPRGWAADGAARAALRRRAPLQLRHLRRARPEARLQHQRLRRDASRPVRMGREAARRELRGGGARSRLQRGGAPLGRVDGSA